MNAEIISIGTELLLGNILNTNVQFISKELALLGINLYYQTVVGDNKKRLTETLKISFNRSDIIITIGGLGPTNDDITKETISNFLNIEMVLDKDTLKHIEKIYRKNNIDITKIDKKEAYIPKGATILKNNNGTASGYIIEHNKKILILLSGPPIELILMYNKYLKLYLNKFSNKILLSKTIKICGISESTAENMIKDLINNQSNPTIASYTEISEMRFRITSKGKNMDDAKNLMNPIIKEIYRRFDINIYGEDETSLEEVIVNMLKEKNLTISIAESCTGGMITSQLINCPNVSKVLKESAITYSNDSKIKRLNINKNIIEKYGVISKEIAIEMAKGMKKISNSDIALSITGIAGPTGDTKNNPIGLVYIAISFKENTLVKKYNFIGNREKIRKSSTINALDFLRRLLIKF